MIVFLNGEFVPEERAVVSVFDRGFLYGDGLFETVRVHRGRPFRWAAHFLRLQQGAGFLGMKLPYSEVQLRGFMDELVRRNNMPESLLRLMLSRGVGLRGYSPKSADRPTLVLALHPVPPNDVSEWRVIVASPRLPADEPLARFKTANKLPQILARAEADAAGADEALLCNTLGEVAEAASSNLFWVMDGMVCTPPLASGILAGVTRSVVLELCGKLGLAARETTITPAGLRQVEGMFVSLSSRGIMEVVSVDGHPLSRSPTVRRMIEEYDLLLAAESA